MSMISYQQYTQSLSARELARELGYSQSWPFTNLMRQALLDEQTRRASV